MVYFYIDLRYKQYKKAEYNLCSVKKHKKFEGNKCYRGRQYGNRSCQNINRKQSPGKLVC